MSKQYSIDLRSDNLPLKNHGAKGGHANDMNSKQCMYSRQNMNFISDDLLSEDSGLHMKLSLHPEYQQFGKEPQFEKPPTSSDTLLVGQSRFNETNF